jgi:hypothetical protein
VPGTGQQAEVNCQVGVTRRLVDATAVRDAALRPPVFPAAWTCGRRRSVCLDEIERAGVFKEERL